MLDPLSESAAEYESEWWQSITTVLTAQEGEGERMVREMEERAAALSAMQLDQDSQQYQELFHQQQRQMEEELRRQTSGASSSAVEG
eukprot:8464800-Pyramimonas_sp.AAC.1